MTHQDHRSSRPPRRPWTSVSIIDKVQRRAPQGDAWDASSSWGAPRALSREGQHNVGARGREGWPIRTITHHAHRVALGRAWVSSTKYSAGPLRVTLEMPRHPEVPPRIIPRRSAHRQRAGPRRMTHHNYHSLRPPRRPWTSVSIVDKVQRRAPQGDAWDVSSSWGAPAHYPAKVSTSSARGATKDDLS